MPFDDDRFDAIDSVTAKPRNSFERWEEVYRKWEEQCDNDIKTGSAENIARHRVNYIARNIFAGECRHLMNDTLYRLNDTDIKTLSNKQKAGVKVIGALVLEVFGQGIGAAVSATPFIIGQTGSAANFTSKIGDLISGVGGSAGRGLGNVAQSYDSSAVTLAQQITENAKRNAENYTEAKRKAENSMDQERRDEDSNESNRSQTVRTLTSNT